MKILHLETSSKNCSVAVSEGENLLCLCEETSEGYKQSESLHTFVSWALEGAGIDLQEIDAVCLGMGPGSYTGLRIGASAAKGFCFGLNVPLVAVNSLHSMVLPFVGKGYDVIIPMIDARRMEVYTATFCGETGKELTETEPKILEENSFSELGKDKKILVVGDGATKAKEILSLSADYNDAVYPSAKYMVKEGVERFLAEKFEDIAYFEPFYLKEFQGAKMKK